MEPVFVHIWKSEKIGDSVHYHFSPRDGVQGTMSIDAVTGDMHLIEPCPGDNVKTFYQCACKAVWNHWSVGDLPETTQYIYSS
ncbi:hypothetical protein OAU50_06575 [Planctomycetota bacterium]|nr:hypothetical protein [Planctomycetota bacterium]